MGDARYVVLAVCMSTKVQSHPLFSKWSPCGQGRAYRQITVLQCRVIGRATQFSTEDLKNYYLTKGENLWVEINSKVYRGKNVISSIFKLVYWVLSLWQE